ALLQLEATGAHEGDSHGAGTDRVALRIERKESYGLCFFDEGGQPHQLRLLQGERVIARHQVGEPCAQAELSPGDYVIELEHAQRGVEGAASEQVFVRMAPAQVPAERLGRPGPSRASPPGGLSEAQLACTGDATLPDSGEAWLFSGTNCEGARLEIKSDTDLSKLDVPQVARSMKLGANTTALAYPNANFDPYTPWWTASTGTTGASYASLTPSPWGSMDTARSVRVITPAVPLRPNSEPVPAGTVSIVPVALQSGWRVSGTVNLERLQFMGPANPLGFDDVVLGPWTALYYGYGTDLDHARVINDTAEPKHLGAVEGWNSITLVWALADPFFAVLNQMIVSSTRSCRYCNLEETNLNKLKLTGVDLSGSNLAGTNCDGADFSKAVLDDTSFYKASLNSTQFEGASARRANFSQAKISYTGFKSAQVQNARFYDVGPPGISYPRCLHSQLVADGADLSGAKFGGACIEYASFKGTNLSSVDFSTGQGLPVSDAWNNRDDLWPSGAFLSNANFTGANLDGAIFGSAQLPSADLTCATITHADAKALVLPLPTITRPTTTDLTAACRTSLADSSMRHDLFAYDDYRFLELTRTKLVGLPVNALKGRSFATARMGGVNLTSLDLTSTDWTGARLDKTQFNRAVLADAGFNDAVLQGAQLAHADLERASFDRAKLGPDPADNKSNGARLTSSFLKDASFRQADLTKAELSAVSLYGEVHLDDANFTGATLAGAYLGGVSFSGPASTKGPVLGGASFQDACLMGADLRAADLRTDGRASSLEGASLQGARLAGARVEGANLSDAVISFDGGLTKAKRLFRDTDGGIKYQIFDFAFEATQVPTATDSDTTCPDGFPGPCEVGDGGRWVARTLPVIDDDLDW
ncbi:MAG: pentapeptide repeat-containing protein, partial [Myxococcaceae bacterium]